MPCQLLVSATTHRKMLKGEIVAVFDEPHTWGTGEVLPKWVKVRILDRSAAQVENFLEKWKNTPDYDVAAPVLGRQQITVTIPARVRSDYPIKGFKASLKTLLEDDWGAIVTVVDPNHTYIVDVPEATDLQALRFDVEDRFEEYIGPRYVFASAAVDQAVALGGVVDVTAAQALSNIIDRTL